jgi:hypothetical protein
MKRATAAAAVSVVLLTGAAAHASRTELPKGVVLFDAAQASWVPGGGPGSVRAPIYGDPASEGPYLHVIKVPPDTTNRAHSYSDTRTYTVISGTWYVGFGDTYDASKLIGLAAGSYYGLPAGQSVFNATKSDGAVIQIGGTGPTRHIETR